MPKARYNWKENNVLARCPDCEAITSFDDKGFSNTKMGISIVDRSTVYEGQRYSRILWHALRCNVCGRGAIAKFLITATVKGRYWKASYLKRLRKQFYRYLFQKTS